jgi:transcriptional regulator
LVVESGEANAMLQGHVARANPIWQEVADGSDVLAIFQGANEYISPKWYPSKQQHGKVVPTWNYLVVHVRGKIQWHEEPRWLRKHLEATTETHEGSDQPWHVSDAPTDFVERMLSRIVGFEISMSELKGKWKLSQNRSEADRQGVVAGLRERNSASAAEMLQWMVTDEHGA